MVPICRVCLKSSLEYIDLETPFECDEFPEIIPQIDVITYLDCFRLCTQLDIDCRGGADGTAQCLCDACGAELKIAYNFMVKAIRADRMLQERHSEVINEEQEETDWTHQQNMDHDYIEQQITEQIVQEGEEELEGESVQFYVEADEEIAEEDEMDENEAAVAVAAVAAVAAAEEDELNSLINQRACMFDSEMSQDICVDDDDEIDGDEAQQLEQSASAEDTMPEEKISDSEIFEDTEFLLPVDQQQLTECSKCGNHFPCGAYEEHKELLNCGSSSVFSCARCPIKFSTRRALMKHHWRAHKRNTVNEAKSFATVAQCDVCDFTGPYAKVREHERKEHLEQYEFHCNICGKTFSTSGTLNAHLKYHQRKEANLKSEACNICGKTFSTQYYLNHHMEVHRDERESHQCKKCNKMYISKTALDSHMRMHTGETTKCPECGKEFVRQYELSVHMRFHTRDYPFKCEVCDKSFAIKGHLRSHMWKHQGLKLQCEECGKLFTSSKALQEHSFTHTVMPFPCSYCEKAYPSRQKYKVHLKRAHSIVLDQRELEKIKSTMVPKPLQRKKLTLVQADSVIKEVEVKTKEEFIEEEQGIIIET